MNAVSVAIVLGAIVGSAITERVEKSSSTETPYRAKLPLL